MEIKVTEQHSKAGDNAKDLCLDLPASDKRVISDDATSPRGDRYFFRKMQLRYRKFTSTLGVR